MADFYAETKGPGSRFSRVSWAAVFAGVIITLVIQALLSLLGIGIGASKFDPLQEAYPGKGFGVGAAIWFLVSTLIAVYVGSKVAGSKSGADRRSDRTLHGLLSWGTSAMIGVLALSTSAGALMGGAGSLLGGATAMSRNRPAFANAAQNDRPGALYPTGRELVTSQMEGQQGLAAEDQAAKRVSQAALWSFAVLALSGIAAGLGAQPKGEALAAERRRVAELRTSERPV